MSIPEDESAKAEGLLATALTGALLQRCLATFVGVGLAEALADGPRHRDDLATACGTHGLSTARLLRLLAMHGVVTETAADTFALTATGRWLVPGTPGSLAARLAPAWQDLFWRALAELPAAVRTGEPAFDHAFGQPLFDYFAAVPAAGLAFDGAMARVSAAEEAAIAAAFRFDRFRHVIDVGGGQGGLLAAVGQRYPRLRRALYDRPAVVAGVSLDGVECIAGDFQVSVPAGADLYVLKRIVHDWDDAVAIALLARVRAALGGPDGRVLVVEGVLRPGDSADPLKVQDIGMLALTPGRERNRAEFAALATAAGLALVGDPVALPGHPVCLLELRPH